MTKRGKKIALISAAVLLLFPLAGAGFYLYEKYEHHKQPKQPPNASGSQEGGQEKAVSVRVVKPEEGGVERIVTRPAGIHSFEYANLYAKVSGSLQNQVVDIGYRVEKNQTLAQIYAPEYQADVYKAEADVTKSKSLVEVMQARVREADAKLDEAKAYLAQKKADVQAAQAKYTFRREQFTRIYNLAKRDAVDQELVDEKMEARQAAESEKNAALTAVDTAKAGVAAAEAHLTRAKADLKDARAEVKVAQATLSRSETFESYTKIRSPYNGVVTLRSYHNGDFIRDASNGGNVPILSVARMDLMRVIVWVPDPYVPYTKKGDKAKIVVAALHNQENNKSKYVFHGTIARTAFSENLQTRTMRAEVDLPNPEGLLENGMYAEVTLYLGKSKEGLTIPTVCLHGSEKAGKRQVYVVRNNKAEPVNVEVGIDDGIRTEILSGLKKDDVVIERHNSGLKAGVPVHVVQQLPEASQQKTYQEYERVD